MPEVMLRNNGTLIPEVQRRTDLLTSPPSVEHARRSIGWTSTNPRPEPSR